jgi:hypothetical protein
MTREHSRKAYNYTKMLLLEIQAQNSSTWHPAPLRPRSHFAFHLCKCRFYTSASTYTNAMNRCNEFEIDTKESDVRPCQGPRHEASMFHQRTRGLGKFVQKLRTINGNLQDRTKSDRELRSSNGYFDS